MAWDSQMRGLESFSLVQTMQAKAKGFIQAWVGKFV